MENVKESTVAVFISAENSKKVVPGIKNMATYLTSKNIINNVVDTNENRNTTITIGDGVNAKSSSVKLPAYPVIKGISHDPNGAELSYTLLMDPETLQVKLTINERYIFNCNKNFQLDFILTSFIMPLVESEVPELSTEA